MLNAKLAKGLAWETVHHLQCALSKILGTAVEWGYIEANPVRMTRLPRRLRNRQRTVLTPDQLRKLLSRLPEPSRSLVPCWLSRDFGSASCWPCAGGTSTSRPRLLRVEQTVYDGHFDEPKSRHGVRLIPLGSSALNCYRADMLRPGAIRRPWLFRGRGTVLDRRTLLSRQLKPVAKALGFGNVNWHCFDTRTPHCTIRLEPHSAPCRRCWVTRQARSPDRFTCIR